MIVNVAMQNTNTNIGRHAAGRLSRRGAGLLDWGSRTYLAPRLARPLPITRQPAVKNRQGQPVVVCRAVRNSGSNQGSAAAETKLEAPRAVLQWMLKRTQGVALASAAAALLLLGLPSDAEERMILRFPASNDPDVYGVQQTLVEAWSVVKDTYVDGGFGGQDWDERLMTALSSAYKSPDGPSAYSEIQKMLDTLGDPYTRIVPPSAYGEFRVTSEGEVQGVGLLIAADAESNKLIVLAPIKGSPADRAGLKAGDLVVSIDGAATDGWDSDKAAKMLRGRSGSTVTVRFARRTDQVPGVPGRPEQPPKVEYKQVNLRRERVELSPVYSTALHAQDGTAFGYIRLMSFSQHAGQDMKAAIQSLKKLGVQGWILDLRNNGGGLVRSGLDVAGLWMEGDAPVFNVTGRPAPPLVDDLPRAAATTASTRATKAPSSTKLNSPALLGPPEGESLMQRVVLSPTNHALTDLPLTVLINENSASASELLAGALRDNARAELVGSTSYGKGRIQSIYELKDGSALFVTVAKYRTPSMQDIDRVGIRPDRACEPVPMLSRAAALLPSTGPSNAALTRLLPYGAAIDDNGELEAELEQDGCVLAAERVLEASLPSHLGAGPAAVAQQQQQPGGAEPAAEVAEQPAPRRRFI